MAKKKCYAVAVGRQTGIFDNWPECQKQVKGFPNAKFKSFKTAEEAEQYIRDNSTRSTTTTTKTTIIHDDTTFNDNSTTFNDNSNKKRKAEEGRDTRNNNDDDVVATTEESSSKRQSSSSSQPKRLLKIHMNFDGGSRGNPGAAGAGAVVIVSNSTTDKNVVPSTEHYFRKVSLIRHYLGSRDYTNNQAEYTGAICGLQMALREAARYYNKQGSDTATTACGGGGSGSTTTTTADLIIQGDSDLIIQQLRGEYQCKSDKLKPLYEQASSLINDMRGLVGEMNLSLEHVYRSDNGQADGLANQAMDARRSWFTTSDDNHEEQFPWPL